ncbi:ABC transporter ATP-binding protein [Alteromonas sediminis]|uniref:ABC transporter ATP-binding protein n=1 Tax=Alteromonas sediminis TaxID=2259342 RepID=A0A3N5Y6B1_9ALTE|nr:ABC transporter ATP-binding protein [Alteromonas sediminis]RPJ65949.1 ABC transporter ATP-binding protein [Alteromonas sediminis]
MDTLISIKGLNKQYSGKPVLDNITFDVQQGQILGLVGPNGAGKTTCLQAILGLVNCEGSIDVLGFDPKQKREKMLTEVAYIADVAVLPKWLKVSQALDYMQGVHPKFDREKALNFLQKTNIPANAKVKALSKGMVTQLHLALILAIDAKVLILDEPTLGLDILTRRQFYTHLLEDFYNDDKCIIVTTHQIEEIENILTHVAFIKDGCIALHDSVDNLKSRFKLVNVARDKVDAAKAMNPLYTHSMMGITTLLTDSEQIPSDTQLAPEDFGDIATPSMADIFVGVMTQEATA